MDTMRHVGDIAKATGLTVRTLHHWEEIGLLVPERSEGGHRAYGPAHVRRLYRIVGLRRLGMPLERIGSLLEGDHDVGAALREQLVELDREIEQLTGLRERVGRVAGALERGVEPRDGDLLDLIEVMTMTETYYTPEQRVRLEERHRQLGEERMEAVQRDWTDLIADAEQHRMAGDDPTGPEMRGIAARWRALVDEFTGGDADLRASLKRMYHEEGPERASRGAIDARLMEYVGHALRVTE
jgi:DNA-binding transcriptional MerR regulator